MKIYLKLALRNVFRYKKRTIITFSAISYGLGTMCIGLALYKGIDRQAVGNIINSETSHLKIFADGYFSRKNDFPLTRLITQPDEILRTVRLNKDVQAAEKRILFQASLIVGMDELPCIGVGLDPGTPASPFDIQESITKGEPLLPEESTKILIGSGLARNLNIDTGDTVVIRLFTSVEDYVWNALDLEVKGIVNTENPMVNSQMVFIPLQVAQEGLGLGKGVTEIGIRVTSRKAIDPVIRELRKALGETYGKLEFESYRELAADFIEFNRIRSRIQAMIPLIMLLIATLGIINTMLMAVLERVKEIGMLRAMGMRKSEIMKLFVLEGVFIGFFGSLAGCVLGGLGGWYLEANGFNFSILGKEAVELISNFYPVQGTFYGDLTFGILLFTLLFGTAVTMLASFYPAYKAVKIDPIQALRHV